MNHHMQKREVPLHPRELQMLDTSLGCYLDYLQLMGQPSKERTKLLNILRAFHLRLKSMLQGHTKGARLWLTDLEVWAIDKALLTFCQRVP